MRNEKEKTKIDLDQYLLLPIFFILLVIATSEARSEESISQSVITSEEASAFKIQSKNLKVNLGLEYSSNLRKRSSPDQDDSTALIIAPSYKISDKAAIDLRVDIIQNHDEERKTYITPTVVGFTPTKYDLSEELSFKPKVSLVLPTDETQREKESYRGSVSLRPTLEYNPSAFRKLTLANVFYFNKNFHEFEVKSNYSYNNEYSIRNRVILLYELNSKLSLELINDYVRLWTYKGNSSEQFYFGQSLGYEFIKNWSASLSHTNEGSVRGPNYNGESVEVFDEKTSYVSMGVSHVF